LPGFYGQRLDRSCPTLRRVPLIQAAVNPCHSDGGRWAVYAGSLDAMPRNFDRRYELFFPVRAPDAKTVVLAELRAQLADDVNAFELAPDGGQEARWQGTIDSQRTDDHRQPFLW
jgi:polyphosphate kinase